MILDVDTGIDDSLAIVYAVGHLDIDLLALTCSAGNVELDVAAANSLGLLDLLGAGEVEVALGSVGPLARPLVTTPDAHGPTGTGHATFAPLDPETRSTSSGRTLSERTGAQLIVEMARARPGEITLVTLGPLTNLAVALMIEPDLPLLLNDCWVMGGAFAGGGNIAPRVEWNIHVDPEAAKVVFHQWSEAAARGATPLTIMGLDVTETAVLTASDLVSAAEAAGLDCTAPAAGPSESVDAAAMAQPFGNPVLDTLRDELRFYFEFHAASDGFYGAHLHDPFVVGAALDPSLITAGLTVVDVALGGAWTDGETIADWRGHFTKAPNAYVATAGDGKEFISRLLAVLTDVAT